VLLPLVFFLVFRPLTHHIKERAEAETLLRAAHDQLELRVRERTGELEQRNREMGVLAEMIDFLHSCATAEEAYLVISRAGRDLFPGTTGALFVYNAFRNELEALASWGEPALNPAERVFAPEECWALRREQVYSIDDPRAGLSCRHVPSTLPGKYLCVPMGFRDEVLGVVHLRSESLDGAPPLNERLAVNLADHVGLALINLKLRETLRDQAIRDPLTGLFNRRYMEETLERELLRAERSQHPVGVVMLDLDRFKQFNDTFGHEGGDLLLRELGGLLRRQARSSDIVCRYGGEEFVLILPDMPLGIVLQRIEALRSGIRQLDVQYRGQPVGTMTVSAGVAMFPEQGMDGKTLLRAADSALYRAKAEGRDRMVVSDTPAASL
jgi:diguanylate cyclase (GGDEF)-like protein